MTRLPLFLSFVVLFTPGSSFGEKLWDDATDAMLGQVGGSEWTHRVEIADLDGDGLVDILFANGPSYNKPGTPQGNRAFLNRAPKDVPAGEPRFLDVSDKVFGANPDISRVIKARDIDHDGDVDIFVGTAFHKGPSRLYLGDGQGGFVEVTQSHLPKDNGAVVSTSIGDAEFGDVNGDGHLDLVLANWGEGNPCVPNVPPCGSFVPNASQGGQVILWLGDGAGAFTDATKANMPPTLVKWSWDLELVDIDNDTDLDLVISSKGASGSFLFENNGVGVFADNTGANTPQERMPQFGNNYEFEPIDFDGDGFLDLLTLNDGDVVEAPFNLREHAFKNNQTGGFVNVTATAWPNESNIGEDDNAIVVLDFDSDGDPDFLVASLFGGLDRLLENKAGVFALHSDAFPKAPKTDGTLGIAVADIDGDGKLDLIQAQGEAQSAGEKVFLANSKYPVDTAKPVVQMIETVNNQELGLMQVVARIHDNKTPVVDTDFLALPIVRITLDGEPEQIFTMDWFGGSLWRARVPIAGVGSFSVCATDAANNEKCSQTATFDL